jgi:hypothetical protein
MDRREFIKLTAGAALLSNAVSPAGTARGFLRNENTTTIPTRVISRQPPLRWEDAMISGNGSTGIMVMGLPLDDCVIVNHEKFWAVGNDYLPRTPHLREAWDEAKKIALKGRYLDADMFIVEEARKSFRRMYGEQATDSRPRYDRTHPGFHLNVSMESNGAPLEYRRETNLETGEISVFWTDNRGDWVRRIFVSRTHNVIAMELTAPAGSLINAKLRLVEAPGKLAGDIGSVRIEHGEAEMYLHAAYGRTMGKKKPEGYHALARVDLGVSFDAGTGMIHYRGPGTGPAIDGQAGTVLRICREHRMSGDDLFLRENWGKIKKAVEYILRHDANREGLTDGQQPNTLDADWFGDIAWIAGLCLAAVRAGEEMALETGDAIFAARCREYFDKGKKHFEEELFDGEYFIQKPDPEKGRTGLGGYNNCHIDQVLGQSWGFQAGLGRIIDKEKTLSALRSLWRYNFTPEVGGYIAAHKGGRPYALAGEGGMIMNTNPRGEEKPYGEKPAGPVGYFHECMSGFEHQVASHMMGEGLVEESLILTRMIHDRYQAAKRNPFNEIECSDHYARAMASYGTFITACGFEHHGPQGFMRFAPRLSPDDFKAAFTAAGSWGMFRHRRSPGAMEARITVLFGTLTLKTLQLEFSGETSGRPPICERDGESVACRVYRAGDTLTMEFQAPVIIRKKEELRITI